MNTTPAESKPEATYEQEIMRKMFDEIDRMRNRIYKARKDQACKGPQWSALMAQLSAIDETMRAIRNNI